MREAESESVSIPVSADTRKATQDVKKIKTELEKVRGSDPTIKIDIDVTSVNTLVKSLSGASSAANDVKGSSEFCGVIAQED